MKKTIFTIFAIALTTSACGVKTEPTNAVFAYAAPACAYQIKEVDGELVPLDAKGGRIGIFERHADGVVQLTTPSGYAPAANECIKRAGFDALIASVHPYLKPAT